MVVRDQLAGKEMSVETFLPRRRNNTAAINRFREVLAKISDDAPCRRGALSLVDAYLSLGIVHERDRCRRARPQLPGQPVVQGCLRRLKGEGYEPKLSQGSWITGPSAASASADLSTVPQAGNRQCWLR